METLVSEKSAVACQLNKRCLNAVFLLAGAVVVVAAPIPVRISLCVSVVLGHGQGSAKQYNHKSDHAFFKDCFHASVSLKLSKVGIIGLIFCHEPSVLGRIHGSIDLIIDTHGYNVNQRNSLFDVRVCPTKFLKRL